MCSTCKGRAYHLARTLPRNLADNPTGKFVLVDYNDQGGLLDYLKASHAKDIASGQLVVYSHREPGPFRMAHAKNMAHRCGMMEGGDVLVNLDADNYAGEGLAEYVAQQFQRFSSKDAYLWSRMVKEGPDRTPRGINGRIAVTAQAFTKVGGYDEQFRVWSPDDKDFNLRLQRLGCVSGEIDRRFLDAILHNDKVRFKEYRHVTTAQAGYETLETVESSDRIVVNYGNIGTGVVYKNMDFERPIAISPLPTRIFGVGMHKTGTTSLHKALTILGYDSTHWPSAHWAKDVWEEVNHSGRSLRLDRCYAVTDLPIALLYQQLDRAYPGSKFILTVRDSADWLRSVERHWSHEHNRYRAAWDTDPFTHRLHTELYGRRKFDADVFLARYRRHNAEVLAYFKGRGNLLTMDAGGDWRLLCDFLHKPVPSTTYPHENGST
jgi:hypothetical protein